MASDDLRTIIYQYSNSRHVSQHQTSLLVAEIPTLTLEQMAIRNTKIRSQEYISQYSSDEDDLRNLQQDRRDNQLTGNNHENKSSKCSKSRSKSDRNCKLYKKNSWNDSQSTNDINSSGIKKAKQTLFDFAYSQKTLEKKINMEINCLKERCANLEYKQFMTQLEISNIKKQIKQTKSDFFKLLNITNSLLNSNRDSPRKASKHAETQLQKQKEVIRVSTKAGHIYFNK